MLRGRLPSPAGFLLPLLLAGLLGGLVAWDQADEQLERAEQVTYDWRFRMRGALPPSDQILVVYVDDESLQRLKIAGGAPTRADFARAIKETMDKGATVVGLDYLLAGATSHDAALVQEMGQEGAAVVLACLIGRGDADWLFPDPRFARMAFGIGFINFFSDSDGKARRTQYRAVRLIDQGGKLVPAPVHSFALELFRVHLDMPPEEFDKTYRRSTEEWVVEYRRRERLRRARLPRGGLVNFVGARGAFRHVPFWKVLEGKLPASTFKGRAVLIGDATTTRAGGDFIHTPFTVHRERIVEGRREYAEDAVPGVEFHASALQSMLEDSFLRRVPPRRVLLLSLCAGLLLGWLLCWNRIPPLLIAGLPLLLGAGLAGAAWFAFRHGLWLDVVRPLGMLALQFAGALGLYIHRQRKQREEITGLFGRYVSQNYVNLLVQKVQQGEEFEQLVAGARREVSVLFSDVRGFTSLSEATDPGLISRILRRYFSEMIRIVREEYQGTMDKLLGDGLMAFYNAPLDQPDHALRACRTALAMVAAVERLEIRDLLGELSPDDTVSHRLLSPRPLEIGVGINSGSAIVGDLGSETFADYTVLGDTVNLAARLEALNKIYGTNVLISEQTHALVAPELLCRRIDCVQVKGRKQAVWIFEVVAERSQASPEQQALCERFEQARAAHESGDADRARSLWEALRKDHPKDGPTAFWLERPASVEPGGGTLQSPA